MKREREFCGPSRALSDVRRDSWKHVHKCAKEKGREERGGNENWSSS